MDRDKEIWNFMLKEKRFLGFTEIRDALSLHDHQLNISLNRLEKRGFLVKTTHFDKNRPVNRYLAIDPDNPNFRVRMTNIKWLYATIECTDPKDESTRVFGIELGDIGSYIRQIDGELILTWPQWITSLAQHGRLTDET